MCVGRGVENFRGFHPILEGSLWENTVRGANICPRPARERAQVSCTPCSSASVGPHLRRRCVCRTPDPTITLLWPGLMGGRRQQQDRQAVHNFVLWLPFAARIRAVSNRGDQMPGLRASHTARSLCSPWEL